MLTHLSIQANKLKAVFQRLSWPQNWLSDPSDSICYKKGADLKGPFINDVTANAKIQWVCVNSTHCIDKVIKAVFQNFWGRRSYQWNRKNPDHYIVIEYGNIPSSAVIWNSKLFDRFLPSFKRVIKIVLTQILCSDLVDGFAQFWVLNLPLGFSVLPHPVEIKVIEDFEWLNIN